MAEGNPDMGILTEIAESSPVVGILAHMTESSPDVGLLTQIAERSPDTGIITQHTFLQPQVVSSVQDCLSLIAAFGKALIRCMRSLHPVPLKFASVAFETVPTLI